MGLEEMQRTNLAVRCADPMGGSLVVKQSLLDVQTPAFGREKFAGDFNVCLFNASLFTCQGCKPLSGADESFSYDSRRRKRHNR